MPGLRRRALHSAAWLPALLALLTAAAFVQAAVSAPVATTPAQAFVHAAASTPTVESGSIIATPATLVHTTTLAPTTVASVHTTHAHTAAFVHTAASAHTAAPALATAFALSAAAPAESGAATEAAPVLTLAEASTAAPAPTESGAATKTEAATESESAPESEAESTQHIQTQRHRGPVLITRVDGAINGAVADHTQEAIEEAETTGAALLILELDTPGGRLDFTKDIITGILNARVPVVVYVAPRGAWAGSAGAFITMAAHIAVMAPGSTIGAAHPVFGGPGGSAPAREGQGENGAPDYMMEKAENISAAYIEAIARERDRNVEWAEKAVRKSEAATAEEALELGVIDLLAEDRVDLLKKLQGRKVRIEDRLLELDIEAAALRELTPGLTSRVFQVIGDPNVAVLLLLAGLALLYFEFNQPGLLFPGIIGAALLALGLLATQMLPFSWTGIVFCLVGLGLIAAELFVASFGVLPAIGLGFLLLGGSMIFDRPDLSDLNVDFFGVLLPAVLGIGLCLVLVVVALSRTMGKKQQSGNSELLGMFGEATTRLAPSGKVFLRGEYWNADADMEIEAGSRIEVVEVRGMRLLVKPAGGAGA